ncbi:hypothetical protein HanIR_Chr07g0330371 [Helianthus annuus]|nr:hypothetical protein HanIR_Chr07g0330371 [Helianthus annuus]
MLLKNHAWQALPNMKEALIVSSWPLTSLPRNLTAIKREMDVLALLSCLGLQSIHFTDSPRCKSKCSSCC